MVRSGAAFALDLRRALPLVRAELGPLGLLGTQKNVLKIDMPRQ